ncbi:MAG: hypothetical protein KatS3mg105_3975 [Gemmatales bacterium]|nr:MAG: hypothetical protein KatS3mg105_3975 [Gemmatales bacterium]
MNRLLLLGFGLLELVAASLIFHLSCQLPADQEVADSFRRARRVTVESSRQVRLMRQQLNDLRRPELHAVAEQLQQQSRRVAETLREQQIDYDTVQTMRDALKDVSIGLRGIAESFSPEGIGQLGAGLRTVAELIEKDLIPAAEQTADETELLGKQLRDYADKLKTFSTNTSIDLKAAKEVHDSLLRFEEGLRATQALFDVGRVAQMQAGFEGLQTALTTGAEQVSRLADYTYPVITFDGLKPVVTKKPFWPDGETIVEGMKKAADGAKAAREELAQVAKTLPALHKSFDESRTVLRRTRIALAAGLEKQQKIEPLLKSLPNNTVRLAEQLPGLTHRLAEVLRHTARLRSVARSLRQLEAEINETTKRWPKLQKTLMRSADLLQAMHRQLDGTLKNRQTYESALKTTASLAELFGELPPLLTKQFETQIEDQHKGLAELEHSIDDFAEAIPVYESSTLRLLQTGRWLLWLVAGLIMLHGMHTLTAVRSARQK